MFETFIVPHSNVYSLMGGILSTLAFAILVRRVMDNPVVINALRIKVRETLRHVFVGKISDELVVT